MTRIRSISVRGFRAYGVTEQTLNLPMDITVVWGPNSKGKTSLAEAFEFLLTGRIARREIMASSQDEFADCLRNAHLPDGQDVYVAARIMAPDGTPHEIKRVLVADYAKKQDCQSRLEIDGQVGSEADLAGLGIILSQPPLEAPVLAQHTLSYIFSVRPQDRATYFKTLLEVTDLEDLRTDVSALTEELKPVNDSLLAKFDVCIGVPVLKAALPGVATSPPNAATLATKLDAAAQALIKSVGETAPKTGEARLSLIEKVLTDRRSTTFPVKEFERKEFGGWTPAPDDVWTRLDTYADQLQKVDEETRRLVALFAEALKLPGISSITQPVDCPLCDTNASLTPERVQLIRAHIANTKDFQTAETAAKAALAQLSNSAEALATTAASALPQCLRKQAADRRKLGFTVPRLKTLLGARADEFLGPWLAQIRPLARAGTALRRAGRDARSLADTQAADIATGLDRGKLRAAFDSLTARAAVLTAASAAYKVPAQALGTALNQVLDAQSATIGWQDFLDIARQPAALRSALIERHTLNTVAKELDAALKQIDSAKENVLNDKFSDYSGLIQAWWERLRPDEQTFFSAIKPRKGAKRTIDFKAGLSPHADRSAAKVRDVIAVFSHSQLHCLGLALFLARAEHEHMGFIVLDDPVLSSDEDYKVHFNSTVLTDLLKLPMQVIVLTQDHDTWEEVEIRYRHVGISTAQLFIDTPLQGTVIENTSDALLAKLSRAYSLARGGHPDSRKECGVQLRDAGERFCKEMLANDRTSKGETEASLSDYDDKTLEWLCPRVEPLLVKDASHPGKLEVFKKAVNRACHDNTPPGTDEMKQACGELRRLVMDYLGR